MRLCRILLSLGMLLLINGSRAYASQSEEQLAAAFSGAASEYQKGNYPAAERYYQQILSAGVENGSVYYNLGNVCFKEKRLGEAIYYWEKARQILPHDREIRENLELANLMLVDRIEAPADPLPIKILSRIFNSLSLSQTELTALLLFLLANLLFFASMRIKNPRTAFRILLGCFVAGLFFLLSAGTLSWKLYEKECRKEAVIVEQKADVRSGPGRDNITVFTLHEGIKVRLLESSNGWYQISLPNGWNGWLPQSELRIL